MDDFNSSDFTSESDESTSSLASNYLLNATNQNQIEDHVEFYGENSEIIEKLISEGYIKEQEIPHKFLCAISLCIMTEVYSTVHNSHAKYELFSIHNWLTKANTDPTTRDDLDFNKLIYDEKTTNKIKKYIDQIIPSFILSQRIEKQQELALPLQRKKSEKAITKKEKIKLNHHLQIIEHLDSKLKQNKKSYRC